MAKLAMVMPVEILPFEPVIRRGRPATSRPERSDMKYFTNFAPKKV